MPRRNVGLTRARVFSSILAMGLAMLGLTACGGGKGGGESDDEQSIKLKCVERG